MSVRRLGGGRVLGNGRYLDIPPAVHKKSSSLASTAESQGSQGDSSSRSENRQDLASVVSLQSTPTVVPTTTQLYCPICNEEMMTLLQLNRHLDDNHQELPVIQQDEVKTWFDKQVIKAKKFQPLVVINQKLKGLDIFEPNGSPLIASPGRRNVPSDPSNQDPDEVVMNKHWQRPGYNDQCTEPSCGRRLGPVNGNVNCRKCGRLFCENHTMYQMKLSRCAEHDPRSGLWCRVCETCFKSRQGYNDHNGIERNRTTEFLTIRRKTVDRTYLEISRLEKRLTKLTQLLTDPPEEISQNGVAVLKLSGQKNQRKIIEQSVVVWEEDASVSKCPLCHQEFGSWSFRRHHCRLCGQIVCGDPRTECSSEISFNVVVKKTSGDATLDIRICRVCQTTVFAKKDFDAEVSHKPPDQRAYENLVDFERGIHLLLPKFQSLLIALQNPQTSHSPSQLAEAAKVRKRLIDSFGKYEIAARRIRDLPSNNQTQLKLQKAVYQQSANFLNTHMLSLKSLPKLLKHSSPHGSSTPNPTTSSSSIKQDSLKSLSQVSSSSTISALEFEEKELTEQLIVLEEQRFMLGDMLAVARKAQRFDEQAALTGNMEELDRECDRLRDMLYQLQTKNIYV